MIAVYGTDGSHDAWTKNDAESLWRSPPTRDVALSLDTRFQRLCFDTQTVAS
jgi:hypothetical protein